MFGSGPEAPIPKHSSMALDPKILVETKTHPPIKIQKFSIVCYPGYYGYQLCAALVRVRIIKIVAVATKLYRDIESTKSGTKLQLSKTSF